MRPRTQPYRILALLKDFPGLDDDEIAKALNIEPRQTVNQICRRLAAQGLLVRDRGVRGKIVNRLAAHAPPAVASSEAAQAMPTPKAALRTIGGKTLVPADLAKTLIILPCSGAKKDYPLKTGGNRITDRLPASLAEELRLAQAAAKARLDVDDERLVPAWQRYDGALYRAGRDGIAGLMEAGAHIVILSGGYGLVSATEPIGSYNSILKPAWWPDNILGRALIAYARQAGLVSVRSFASAKSAYRQVLERVPWQAEGVEDSLLILPEPQSGGMFKSPATIGEALVALDAGTLTADWRSSYGLGIDVLRR